MTFFYCMIDKSTMNANTEKTKILIVDDAAFIKMRLVKVLNSKGYEVYEADNGKMSIDIYKKVSPHIVFMDVDMPVMDGITALREIKKIDLKANVIMLTSVNRPKIVKEAQKYGARKFLLKPFDDQKILSTIKDILN